MSTSAIVLGGGHVPVLHSSHACFMSEEPTPQPNRRGLLGSIPFWFMTGGLAAGYGTCATMGGRYLFPEGGESVAWMFLGAVDDFEPGGSLDYKAPNGQKIAVARQGTSGGVEDFVALSSTCPHLGCQVHWEGDNDRFFCPCHNGAFDKDGVGISGPPGDAGQSLPQFPLRVQNGLLFIQVAVAGLASADRPHRLQQIESQVSPGAGHDPCLGDRPPDSGEMA
tara:strand:- start:6918 stop:7586 length:669 start_codon:yes stop_codon:yes gene_type:complete